MSRSASLSTSDVQKVRKLREKGLTYQQILDDTGLEVTIQTIRKVCLRLGAYA